ncbi:MAG TPA: Hsp20/alpha crystallin family protein [Ideonella sp.]|uniref:Hsp20/alpha crystallin family protein n=1 Tax=Ideonella sp. TaxID=1929293 RepID=UPI002E361886|nr:Hsp20/alpha crystallin family protein [Ideonella sp.]HEX5684332.1 Hsp20/alpha crystallin family protein [Ideonella sp.]
MYETLWSFPGGVLGEFERLRRELDDVFGGSGMPSSIRSAAPGAFPAINVGQTPSSVELYAFAPGIDPAKIDVVIDRGVLTISGERASALPRGDAKTSIYNRERASGTFKRAISLPDDVDPGRVNATYRDGVLNVSIARREEAQPKRIAVQ